MLIEDVEAFKTWLGKTLQPICDADPLALAKYVVALVKKDKLEEELRTSCFDQLEVFLQDKTKNFVATLFEALKSKIYIQAVNNSSPALPPSNSSVKSEPRKSSRSDESSDDHRRKRSHSRSPGRDRDRGRRNYDDRRRNDNDRGSRSHSRYDSDYRSRHRTRSRSRSPRSRSPRQRSRSVDRSKHKSRSPDRIPVHRASDSRGSTPVQDDTNDRPNDPPRGPVISSEVIVPPHSGYHSRERPPPRPRCRDYDEKGFCMRGDLCPFDHGVDPVVLDDVVTFNSGGPPPSGPRGPSPGPPGGPHGPPGGPHGPPGGPPHGPPGGPHGPPSGPRGPPGPSHGLPGGLHDHRGPPPPPPHHMPPMPQEPGGPRPLRPMLHHGPPPSRPPPQPQGPPPPQQGPPPPRPPLPPHPGDHAHVPGPSQGTVQQLGGVESTRLPPSQAPSAFHPLPPPSQQLPPQQGPPPPSTQSMRTEYQPEPYNPEAPMLRNKTNDFWRGNHGRGRGRGRGTHSHDRGGHAHDRDGHGHDRSSHGNERDMERDRMRHQFQPQHPRRDLVSIPTIPEPSEEEPPTVAPQNNSGGREGGGIASRVVVPSKRKYELSGEPDQDIDAIPYKQQHMMQPHPQHHPPHHPPHHQPPHHQPPHHQQHHHQGPPQQQPWASAGPGHKKPHFDFKRLGPQRRVHANPDNCTLELRRVPREHNNIAKLNEHFSKFGHIVNLQVCYEGDTEAALITFLTNAQAQSAYRSPEPVLNNRFIKVFWHKGSTEDSGEAEAGASNEPTKLSIKERLGEIPPPHKLQLNNNKPTAQPPADGNSQKVVVSPLGLTKTVFNLTAMKKSPMNTRLGSQQQQQLKQQRQQELQLRQQLQAGLVQKKKQQDQEIMKKKMAIQKEKQLLLHKQINKQKLLIGKLESPETTPEQKTKIMKTIKTLADIIETLKTDLTTTTLKPKVVPVKSHLPRTKQEAQKEILDTELDIIAKQNEGADTSALRRRVAALKKEATVLGLLGHGARGRGALRGGRGRGTTRGGRGGHVTTLSVDRRPKQLLVVGFEPVEKDSVVELLSKDGGVETVLHDDTAVTMVITYQTRLQAEQAITTAGEYDKGQLGLSWYKPGSGSGDREVAEPISVQDEALLTEVTGQVLSRHNSLVGAVEEEEPEEVIVPGAGPEEPVIEDDDDDDEDVLRVGEGEDEENMPAGIGDHELDDEMDEDLLLGVDEEEDEEEEGRSWRR